MNLIVSVKIYLSHATRAKQFKIPVSDVDSSNFYLQKLSDSIIENFVIWNSLTLLHKNKSKMWKINKVKVRDE